MQKQEINKNNCLENGLLLCFECVIMKKIWKRTVYWRRAFGTTPRGVVWKVLLFCISGSPPGDAAWKVHKKNRLKRKAFVFCRRQKRRSFFLYICTIIPYHKENHNSPNTLLRSIGNPISGVVRILFALWVNAATNLLPSIYETRGIRKKANPSQTALEEVCAFC